VERLRIEPDNVERILGIDPNDPLEKMAKAYVEARDRAEAAEAEIERLRAEVESRGEQICSLVDRKAVLRDEVERLRGEVAEYDPLLTRQGDLLTRAANALRGDPPPLMSWSHHDVPELARTLADHMAKVKALAAEHDHCSGCPTPWWLRAALADAPAEQCESSGMTVARCKSTDLCDCFADGGLHPEAFVVGAPTEQRAEGGADVCSRPGRVDGPWHSWKFDGDDPHIICHFCDEMRDSLTGRVIRPAAEGDGRG
jgi:hypothetical protein